MPHDPKHPDGHSTSNRHEGQAEYLVQAGQVSGGITINNAADSRRRRGPWGVIGAVGGTLLIAYLLALAIGGQPPGTGTSPTPAPETPPAGGPPTGQNQLRSLESGFCVTAVDGGHGIAQLPCTQNPTQLWNVKTVPPNNLTMFSRIRGVNTETCLELPENDSRPDGAVVQVAHCVDDRHADNQLWQVEPGDKPGYVRIRNDRSEQRCLSPSGPQQGAQLVIKDCAGGRGSQWVITRP